MSKGNVFRGLAAVGSFPCVMSTGVAAIVGVTSRSTLAKVFLISLRSRSTSSLASTYPADVTFAEF